MEITWQDLVRRAKHAKGVPTPILTNPTEARKYFDWFIKNRKELEGRDARFKEWAKLPKDEIIRRLFVNIGYNLRLNKGVFKIGIGGGAASRMTWDKLTREHSTFPEWFEKYLGKGTKYQEQYKNIGEKKIPLKEKYNLLSQKQQIAMRKAFRDALPYKGLLNVKEFAPLTNFSNNTVQSWMHYAKEALPKKITEKNVKDFQRISRAQSFKDLLGSIGIVVTQKEKLGHIYFTKPDKTQQAALDRFTNFKLFPSTLERNKLVIQSHAHPLYKDTSQNLKILLNASKKNLNTTISDLSNKGLRELLKQQPNLLKNATMWFDASNAKFNYTPLADLSKKDFNFNNLRKNLKFEIEHNRSINNYWKDLSHAGKLSVKKALLNDAEFAHNLSLDTNRYNKAKVALENWIESPVNRSKTVQIASLDKELGELGHRLYAGDKWRGRGLDIKSGYRDTVIDSWSKALERSSGFKFSEQFKHLNKENLTRAMKEVEYSPKALRQLGTFLGCPGTFAAEGGRIGFQTGGTGLTACVNTKLKQPGAIEKIAALPGEIGGPLSKLKNTATTFLGMLGRGGARAAPLAAVAALGAIAEPLVKQFRSDDYSTYLSDPEQQKGMLLSMLEAETPKVDQEILKWQMPAHGAATLAGAVPGAGEVYKARRALRPQKLPGQPAFIGPMPKGVGPARAALGIKGVLGKALGASFSPLAVAATLPLTVAAQRSGGTDYSDIATDPMNWMGPAFAASGAEMATKGIKNPMLLRALRLGFSPGALRMGSRFLGLPGLALTGGMWAYDKWKDRDKDDEFKVRKYTDDED